MRCSTRTKSMMSFSGWLTVSHIKTNNTVDINPKSADNEAILCFCIVVNGHFTVASNESLNEIIFMVPLSTIKSVTMTNDQQNEFSVILKINSQSQEFHYFKRQICNENHTDSNETGIDDQNQINNQNQNSEVIEIEYKFKCSRSSRANKWIVALTSRPPIVVYTPSINDFVIEKKIGSGYSGEVLLAQNIRTMKYYALKSIPKQNLMKSHRIMRTMAERNILMRASHPFITNLVSTFQTSDRLFLVLEFVSGGDLLFHMNRSVMFEDSQIKLYLAEIATALSYLHNMGIVFRDLKPSNILIGEDGHLKLTDFGHAKYLVDDKNNTCKYSLCGTYEYLAPEMIEQNAYTFAVDWWAFGVLAYQMICGILPFKNMNLNRLFYMIVNTPLRFMTKIDSSAQDMIEKLLIKNPSERLGCGEKGEKEIFDHPYFADIDWDLVYNKKYQPSFLPDTTKYDIVANFEKKITSQVPEINRVSNDENCNLHVNGFSFSNFAELSSQEAKDL
ncbi:RAC-alpha serine/threonine-protein kinase [Tritrichomonas foetus]|uniref:RAC-alpha serine/threonine-protein kinase n=1 Tax=Tritrichomonas foetus TaxID=1144522 RepID=A0A1J4JE03_9EUKA|nr:RAC-alpha serine/threonine-protein kinase [Tritrichomonas foetus]|eukprot:OHS97430.1 RAC-alpha serine/threonine-protein kinase [Tritrichomonas foetus]